jgi:hypothetical protein
MNVAIPVSVTIELIGGQHGGRNADNTAIQTGSIPLRAASSSRGVGSPLSAPNSL